MITGAQNQEGVRHVVTLSEAPSDLRQDLARLLQWSVIEVDEFEPPSLQQIRQFISICENARKVNQAVGVHCRMGRGRTGVMAACFLTRFCDLAPSSAICNLRLMRPGSVETFAQERAVHMYHDFLRTSDTELSFQ
ncbi:dual specificity protein phosphatase 23-like [Neocloeon triangulifer]|uniref:dual specificity protein phosphatase 23-like n=1 Tax=Neocloeon triangulifer TaxID=2078957 RepID=UPI00286EF515|nr:dual specificity protein phosphatase 23-like [Neocloeon triangulifer]